ncbi:MAG TPA: methyltransferase [Candidatus Binatia bacterium]|nr:methyltransferase [Candidatus Binatia bacterium]
MAGITNETTDALFEGRVKLLQSRLGYRVSVDALLLAAFVSIHRNERVVDLGAGNSVLCLALAHWHPSALFTGIELQAAMVERAQRNVRLNGLEERVKIIPGDLRNRKHLPPAGSFDVAVCNPPYRPPASGRISANDEKRIARHELHGDITAFLRAGAFLLRNKGRLALVFPAVRCVDAISAMRLARIEPKRLRTVHSFHDSAASLVLLEGVKNGRAGVAVEKPLTIYRPDKEYTVEAATIIGGTGR